MKKSIVTNDMENCMVCGVNKYIEYHHVFGGTSKRKISDEYGLIVPLCKLHHTGTNGVHGKNGSLLNKRIKQHAQTKAMVYYDWSIEEWIKIMGKNYLD